MNTARIARALALTLVMAAVLGFEAAPARAADECIAEQTKTEVWQCPAGAPPADLLGAVRAQWASHPPASIGPSDTRSRPTLESRELSSAQKTLVTGLQAYLCQVKPAPADAGAKQEYAEVMYALGRVYFETYHWERAAEVFRKVARSFSDTEVGVYAAMLYLEAANVVGSRIEPPRPACYDLMKDDVPVFLASYCDAQKRAGHTEACATLERVERDFARLAAESLTKECDKGLGEAASPARTAEQRRACAAAGDRYLGIWTKYFAEPCERAAAECARAEEILYNAARAYQAGRALPKANQMRETLIDPKYHLHTTELGKKALYELGASYHALFDYPSAATWYERYADANQKGETASDALADAVVLRLGLGQIDLAIGDADRFQSRYATRRAAQAAQVQLAIAAMLGERNDWEGVYKRLNGAMTMVDSAGAPEVRLEAHALLGRAAQKTARAATAETEYSKVADGWRNPAAVVEAIQRGGEATPVLRRVGRALNAVGEALFYAAEQKRQAAEAIAFPEYTGSGETKDVETFLKDRVAAWLRKRTAAIETAAASYFRVKELQPEPPPAWVVRAAAATGKMWGDATQLFHRAPYPKAWNVCEREKNPSPARTPRCYVPSTLKDPDPMSWLEVRGAYLASLDEASEGMKGKARAAYVACVTSAAQAQYTDDDARGCEGWLAKYHPGDYPVTEELLPAPARPTALLAWPLAELDLLGNPKRSGRP